MSRRDCCVRCEGTAVAHLWPFIEKLLLKTVAQQGGPEAAVRRGRRRGVHTLPLPPLSVPTLLQVPPRARESLAATEQGGPDDALCSHHPPGVQGRAGYGAGGANRKQRAQFFLKPIALHPMFDLF